MDMPDPGRALAAAAKLLRPNGRLVFSICHPCTDTPYRQWDRDAGGSEGVDHRPTGGGEGVGGGDAQRRPARELRREHVAHLADYPFAQTQTARVGDHA
jgi:hypothetical protein